MSSRNFIVKVLGATSVCVVMPLSVNAQLGQSDWIQPNSPGNSGSGQSQSGTYSTPQGLGQSNWISPGQSQSGAYSTPQGLGQSNWISPSQSFVNAPSPSSLGSSAFPSTPQGLGQSNWVTPQGNMPPQNPFFQGQVTQNQYLPSQNANGFPSTNNQTGNNVSPNNASGLMNMMLGGALPPPTQAPPGTMSVIGSPQQYNPFDSLGKAISTAAQMGIIPQSGQPTAPGGFGLPGFHSYMGGTGYAPSVGMPGAGYYGTMPGAGYYTTPGTGYVPAVQSNGLLNGGLLNGATTSILQRGLMQLLH